MKIRKGDKVRILAGKDRGREGKVSRAIPADRKVIVEGVNIAKRHQKSTSATIQGGIIDKGSPVDRFHRSQHAIIRDPLLTQAQDKSGSTEWIGDQVFHNSRSVRRNTSCVKST